MSAVASSSMTNSPQTALKLALHSLPRWILIPTILALITSVCLSLKTLDLSPIPLDFLSDELGLILIFVFSFPVAQSLLRFAKTGEGYEFLLALLLTALHFGGPEPFREAGLVLLTAWLLSLSALRLTLFSYLESKIQSELSVEGLGPIDSPLLRKARWQACLASSLFFVLAFVVYLVWDKKFENGALATSTALAVTLVAIPSLFYFAVYYTEATFRVRAASLGIRIDGPDVLQKFSEVTHIAFDKTASLTFGEPHISLIKSLENISNKDCLQVAASVEKSIEHPIASALLKEAASQNVNLLEASEVLFEPSKGVKATLERGNKKQDVLFGNLVWLFENSVESTMIPDELRWEAEGSEDSVLWLAVDGKPTAIFTLSDDLREGARDVVQRLEAKKYEVGLITADSETVARTLAKRLKLKFFHFEISPKEKPLVISRLSEKKKKGLDFIFPKVMFIGDAVTDTKAMKAAHIGVNLGRGPEENSDVFIAENDLGRVLGFIFLADKASSSQSLFSTLVFVFHIIGFLLVCGLPQHIFNFGLPPVGALLLAFCFSLGLFLLFLRSFAAPKSA